MLHPARFHYDALRYVAFQQAPVPASAFCPVDGSSRRPAAALGCAGAGELYRDSSERELWLAGHRFAQRGENAELLHLLRRDGGQHCCADPGRAEPGLWQCGRGAPCTTKTYTTATNCTVNVTFTPKAAGLRMGAVVFFSGANNTGTVLANVPVYGVGTGAQIAYGPGTAIAISPTVNGEGLNNPTYLAVDGAGDLFIADTFNNRVVEVPSRRRRTDCHLPDGEWRRVEQSHAAWRWTGRAICSSRTPLTIAWSRFPAGGGAAIAISPTVSG
jgi:hypothetical protein